MLKYGFSSVQLVRGSSFRNDLLQNPYFSEATGSTLGFSDAGRRKNLGMPVEIGGDDLPSPSSGIMTFQEYIFFQMDRI